MYDGYTSPVVLTPLVNLIILPEHRSENTLLSARKCIKAHAQTINIQNANKVIALTIFAKTN